MEEINERKEETGTGQQKDSLRDVLKLSLRCWQVVFQRKPLQRHLASQWKSAGRTGRCKFFSSVNASGALKGDSVLKQSSLAMKAARLLCFWCNQVTPLPLTMLRSDEAPVIAAR
jgi:hypothetical protein